MNWMDKAAEWGWGLFLTVAAGLVSWFAQWKRGTDRDIAELKLHVSETYVKKSDLVLLKQEIADQFREVKDGQDQILDVLLGRKIGTTARRK